MFSPILSAFNQYFNSIKVQLELLSKVHWLRFVKVFQFHKGTIRTFGFQTKIPILSYFNSIKVQLERGGFHFPRSPVLYFNSIKVQLELLVLWLVVCFLHNFNSIKVQLELHLVRHSKIASTYFNSIKVQLEQMYCMLVRIFVTISIP